MTIEPAHREALLYVHEEAIPTVESFLIDHRPSGAKLLQALREGELTTAVGNRLYLTVKGKAILGV